MRSDDGDVLGVVTIPEEEDASALKKAREIAELVIYSLILSTNIGLSLEDLRIMDKVGDPRPDNVREVFDFVRISDHVHVKVIQSKEGLDNTARYLGAFRKLSERELEYVARILNWYRKGAMEDDPIDKFIDWYVSLEVLGEYRYPTCKLTQRVKKVVADFKETASIDDKKLIKFRGTLFHSGLREHDAREYCSGLDAVILNGVREIFVRI